MKKIILLLLVFFLFNCAHLSIVKNAEASIKRGDFFSAVMDLTEALISDNYYGKAKKLLVQYYPKAVSFEEESISAIDKGNNPNKWEKILKSYDNILRLQRQINKLPKLTDNNDNPINFELKDYSRQIEEAKIGFSEDFYQNALKFLDEKSDKERLKKAARFFKFSQKYFPDYKDSKNLYKVAINGAKKRIVVFVKNNSVDGHLNSGDIEKNIFAEFENPSGIKNDLVEIINFDNRKISINPNMKDEEIIEMSKDAGADEVFIFQIDNIAFTPPYISTNSYETTKEVDDYNYVKAIIDLAVKKETDEKTKTIVVKATVNKFEVATYAQVAVNIKIAEIGSGKIRETKNISERDDFRDTWATYTGDYRALSAGESSLCSKSSPSIPDKYEMFSKALSKIGKTYGKFFRTYNNYDQSESVLTKTYLIK